MTSARIFDLISIICVLLALVSMVVIGVLLVLPPAEPGIDVAALPTLVPTRTPTPTETPGPPTLPPTFTPTPSDTPTPTETPTDLPTVPPTATITDTPGPTLTPSETFTPSVSPTFTPSLTPTGPTPTLQPTISPYPFGLRDSVRFTNNFANTQGCAWQGMGGQVLGIGGAELTGSFQVRVFNNEIDRVVNIGSNSMYGPISGWEVPVDTTINNRTYFVQLETVNGVQISPRIEVTFPQDCNQNAAIITFIQIRPL